jgi:hypothetical protein
MLCFERLKEDCASCFYYVNIEFPPVVTYENYTNVLCVRQSQHYLIALYTLSDVQNVSVTEATIRYQ